MIYPSFSPGDLVEPIGPTMHLRSKSLFPYYLGGTEYFDRPFAGGIVLSTTSSATSDKLDVLVLSSDSGRAGWVLSHVIRLHPSMENK